MLQTAKTLQTTTHAARHAALHQVQVVTARSRADVPPAMPAVERKGTRVGGADAQLSGLHSVSTHKIHGVVLKFTADSRPSHLLDQVKEVHVAAARLLEDLHLHLSDDPAAVPGMNASVREAGQAQPESLEVVRVVGSGPIEKNILAKAA